MGEGFSLLVAQAGGEGADGGSGHIDHTWLVGFGDARPMKVASSGDNQVVFSGEVDQEALLGLCVGGIVGFEPGQTSPDQAGDVFQYTGWMGEDGHASGGKDSFERLVGGQFVAFNVSGPALGQVLPKGAVHGFDVAGVHQSLGNVRAADDISLAQFDQMLPFQGTACLCEAGQCLLCPADTGVSQGRKMRFEFDVMRVDVISQDVELILAWYVGADLYSWDHSQTGSTCGLLCLLDSIGGVVIGQ